MKYEDSPMDKKADAEGQRKLDKAEKKVSSGKKMAGLRAFKSKR